MDILIKNLQGSLDNPETLILLSMFLAVVLLVMGGTAAFAGVNPVKRRLKTRVRSVGSIAAEEQRSRNITKAGKVRAAKNEKKQAENDPAKTSSQRRKLVQAGYMGSNALTILQVSKIVGAAIVLMATLFAAPYVVGSLPASKLAIYGVIAAAVGFYIPTLWIQHRIETRQEEARLSFPDALDMLLVCVEAGLSLAAALNRVGQEIGRARPVMGEQFRLVALEMQAGKSREEALRNFADRVGIDEVRTLVTLLLQSEALGTSIGLSLRVHADEMRRKRLVKAEERGNKLPVKMTLPLIFFILPSLLSVVMTPLVIKFIRIIAPTLTGAG
jgi:tight adherence protein C